MHPARDYTPEWFQIDPPLADPARTISQLHDRTTGTVDADGDDRAMTVREAKSRAVKILAKSIYRDLEAQGFDEKQIVALATELISEVTAKMSRGSSPDISVKSQHA